MNSKIVVAAHQPNFMPNLGFFLQNASGRHFCLDYKYSI